MGQKKEHKSFEKFREEILIDELDNNRYRYSYANMITTVYAPNLESALQKIYDMYH